MKTIRVPIGGMTEDGCLWDGTRFFFAPDDWKPGDPLDGFDGDTDFMADPQSGVEIREGDVSEEGCWELPEAVREDMLRQCTEKGSSSDGQIRLSARPQAVSHQRKTMFSKFTILSE